MTMAPATKKKDAGEDLLAAARAAKVGSYSPYSRFRVGAAVLLENGEVVTGANIENASYGLTCCAERVALFSAIVRCAGNKSSLRAIAVSCGDTPGLPDNSLMPCGACRQVMVELLPEDAPVYIDGLKPSTVKKLLPVAFKIDPPNP
jgi:cytidine deaminase